MGMRDQVEEQKGAIALVREQPIPAFTGGPAPGDLRDQMTKAVRAWLLRTPSPHTRKAYVLDLAQFLAL